MCIAIFGGEKNIELDFNNNGCGDIEQFNGGWRKFTGDVVKGCGKYLKLRVFIKKESGYIEKACEKLNKCIGLLGKLHA